MTKLTVAAGSNKQNKVKVLITNEDNHYFSLLKKYQFFESDKVNNVEDFKTASKICSKQNIPPVVVGVVTAEVKDVVFDVEVVTAERCN